MTEAEKLCERLRANFRATQRAGDMSLVGIAEDMADAAAMIAAQAEGILRFREALEAVHRDLLMRGTKDDDGVVVVDVGFSVWQKVCQALTPKT